MAGRNQNEQTRESSSPPIRNSTKTASKVRSLRFLTELSEEFARDTEVLQAAARCAVLAGQNPLQNQRCRLLVWWREERVVLCFPLSRQPLRRNRLLSDGCRSVEKVPCRTLHRRACGRTGGRASDNRLHVTMWKASSSRPLHGASPRIQSISICSATKSLIVTGEIDSENRRSRHSACSCDRSLEARQGAQ